MPHPTLPTTGPLDPTQVRTRLRMLEAFLREPCTLVDRRNARELVMDTIARLPETDVVGLAVAASAPVPLLDRLREADGADYEREVL